MIKKRSSIDSLLRKCPEFLLIWATVVFTVGMFRGQTSVSKYLALKDSEIVLKKVVATIENDNAVLSKEIHKLKESRDYARKVLRDRYHVTESDEKIIYFAD
jgi:cell division protein FtsB